MGKGVRGFAPGPFSHAMASVRQMQQFAGSHEVQKIENMYRLRERLQCRHCSGNAVRKTSKYLQSRLLGHAPALAAGPPG